MLSNLWGYLSKKRKRQFFIVLLMTILASVLEALTIGTVVPLLAILVDPSQAFTFPVVDYANDFLGLKDSRDILFFIVILFISIAIFSGAVRLILNWQSINLAYSVGADLSVDIYRRTLYQPYMVHISRNSSEVISGVIVKVNSVISGSLMPVINIVSASIILIFILVTLLLVNPQITIFVAIAFWAIYFLINRKTRSLKIVNGATIAHESGSVVKILQEGIGGIRDILIDRNQETFIESYRKADSSLRRASSMNLFLGQSPRYVIETLGIALIALLAFFLINKMGVSAAIPILGALAVGSQRLLPLMQQLYVANSSIQAGGSNLRDVLRLLEQSLPAYLDKSMFQLMAFEGFIKFDSVAFKYQSSKKFIFSDLGLVISKGDRIGIVGRSGSGKSTFGDLLMGLLEPNSGRILVDGVEINNKNYHLWQMNIAHVPQSIFLSDATFEENIAFGVPVKDIDRQRVIYAATKAKIAEFIDGFPDKYQAKVGERGVLLSGGQRQRIGIARALYKRASLIILDEATSSLDAHTESGVLDAIENFDESLTLITIAHRIHTLKGCNRIIELKDGNIVLDTSYQDYMKNFLGQ